MLQKSFASIGLFLLLSAPVVAKTTVVSSLGEAPLLGELRSTDELTQEVFKQSPRLSKAAAQLGLTPQQYDELTTDIATDENVRWVTVPRHLDAMSWQTNGRVHVIHDVMIPANTHGWAVYLKDGITAYVPAKCGNLSVLHTPTRRVAAVKAATAPAPVEEAPAPEVAPPVPPPVAVAPAPVEFPTPTPLSAIPPPPPVHHSALAAIGGFLLLPLIAVAAMHGGSPGMFSSMLPGIAGAAPGLAPAIPSIAAPAIAPIIAPVIAPPGACCGCGCP